MSDRDRVGRVGLAAHTVALEIPRIIGGAGMSPKQTAQMVGLLLGFWCAEEDTEWPRADGQSWKDIVKKELNP